MLDPLPRVVLVPGLGLFGLGRSKKEARVAADLAECAIETITDAEAIGRFESITEADMFDMEYWSLEQAKLGSRQGSRSPARSPSITGAAGAIGAATAKAFAAAGAEVALLDIDEAGVTAKAKAIGGAALAVRCDVTDAASVARRLRHRSPRPSAASTSWSRTPAPPGRAASARSTRRRCGKSFELNFYGHQRVAQAAVKIMLAQGTGGCLLFNVSKQAVNPGPNFGPYGLPKAATLFLVRQYAVDYGADGIRANAVNADRIRSGLLTDDFIAERSKARGVSEKDYMSGNLLAPRGHRRGRRAGLPGTGAGAQDHRRRDHRRRRQHRGGAAVGTEIAGGAGNLPTALQAARPPGSFHLDRELWALPSVALQIRIATGSAREEPPIEFWQGSTGHRQPASEACGAPLLRERGRPDQDRRWSSEKAWFGSGFGALRRSSLANLNRSRE